MSQESGLHACWTIVSRGGKPAHECAGSRSWGASALGEEHEPVELAMRAARRCAPLQRFSRYN
jgi:hypothetical protein